MKIWINNKRESVNLIEILENKGFEVNHILTASPLPVVRYENELIVGLGNIRKYFRLMP